MRDIKFQVLWVRNNSDFTKSIEAHYTTLDRLTNGKDSFPYSEVEVIAKRQYTGLKDKDGVEIYERSEVDEMLVKWNCESISYVLINISSGDIFSLADYVRDKNGQVEVTKEYTEL